MSAIIKLSSPATREFWEIPVLFEDEHLLALDKPARLLTSPDALDLARPSLMKLLHSGIAAKKPWASERHLDYLNPLNELDFDVTGVLLLAKNKPAFIALANLASSGKVRIHYLALVRGELLEREFEVDAKLAPHPVKPDAMRVDRDNGKQADPVRPSGEFFARGLRLAACRTHLGAPASGPRPRQSCGFEDCGG